MELVAAMDVTRVNDHPTVTAAVDISGDLWLTERVKRSFVGGNSLLWG